MNDMNRNDQNLETPAELRATEAAADALARAEQDAAPATLEARVFMATRALLPQDAPLVVVRRTVWFTRMRVAAAIAIVGGIGTVWLAQGGGARTFDKNADLASLEADVDFILAMKSGGLSSTRDGIDALFLDADTLGDSLKKHDGSLLDEGSM